VSKMGDIRKLGAAFPELKERRWFVSAGGTLIVLLALPLFLGAGDIHLLSRIFGLSIAAMGFNLLWGYTGIITFGHAAFYGVGAYSFGLLLGRAGFNFGISIIFACIMGSVAALIIGFFVLRLRGMFLAVTCMAFAQMLWAINIRLQLTGGADGLAIGVPPVLISQINCYYLTFGSFIVTIIILRIIVNSSFGLTLKAVRDQAIRVEFLGVSAFRYQLAAFAISGFFTAFSGALMALLIRYATPEMFYWMTSGNILLMCLIGGIKVFLGPVLGTVVFEIVDGLVTRYTVYWSLVLGIFLILVVIFFHEGITGFVIKRRGVVKQ
jgi:branched-chain amino acid transport system permease protein